MPSTTSDEAVSLLQLYVVSSPDRRIVHAHEIAATADKSRGHPSSTACYIVLAVPKVPANPRSAANQH